ncbi:uncharacterized protein LOC126835336 [Adelges cooleyi]|uniref:uncharacterized protein LOC126835336 n=1 Tax=Adelges cooleyi TaxID=133065 RepID=UPI00217FF9A9|nr:uncharacterized protein LOC126835336 [Adelges cooleyi]
MHFKSAVIFCALYFVTMTQSIGLTRNIINRIVVEFERVENSIDQISPNEIEEIIKDMGVQDLSGFTYEADTKDGRKVQQLLVLLAQTDKPSDHWLKRRLSSQEVTIYLNLFEYHDQKGGEFDGLINSKELNKIVEALNLNESEKQMLTGRFEGDLTINFAEFIQAFFEIKPQGNGLEEKQIDELILIKDDKEDGAYIKTTKITQFFIGLSIVNGLDEKLVFDRIQYSALELQELVLVSAEYNRSADKKTGTVYSTEIVKEVLADFHQFDHNQNGKICKHEAIHIERMYFPKKKNFGSLIDAYDTDADGLLDVAELFRLMFKERVIVV